MNAIEGLVAVQGMLRRQAEERGRELLARVGLSGREGAYPRELSGQQAPGRSAATVWPVGRLLGGHAVARAIACVSKVGLAAARRYRR